MGVSAYSVALLESMLAALHDVRSHIGDAATAVMPLLLVYGDSMSASATGAALVGSEDWAASWVGSLQQRLERLAAMRAIRLDGNGAGEWGSESECACVPAGAGDELLAVATAMLAGIPPSATALPPHLFPEWYVEVHRQHAAWRALRGEASAALLRLDLSPDGRRNDAAAGPARRLLVVMAAALILRIDQLTRHIESLVIRLAVDLDTAAAHLAGAKALPVGRRQILVAVLLGREMAAQPASSESIAAVGAVLARRVTTPQAAATFLAMLDPGLLPAMAAHSELSPHDFAGRAIFMAPFAGALARASHSGEQAVDIGRLVEHRDAASWFTATDYDADFLIAALVAAVATAVERPVAEAWVGDELVSSDVRLVIVDRLVELDEAVAARLLGALRDAGVLGEFLDPQVAYPDRGERAGEMLRLLGADPGGVSLMVDVMAVVAAGGAPGGVLRGTAAMLAPHLGALATGEHGDALPPSPLRFAVDELGDGRAALLRGVLTRLMADDEAASVLLSAYSLTLAQAVAGRFDADRPESVAEPFAESGRLFDQLSDAYLTVRLEAARRADAASALQAKLVASAVDAAVAAIVGLSGGGKLAETGVAALASLLRDAGLASVGLEVFPTDRGELVLASGYEMERDAVYAAELLLAVYLDAAGLISLPSEWYREGSLQPPSRRVWDAFLVGLETEGFPVDAWFNHPAAIGGHADFDPLQD